MCTGLEPMLVSAGMSASAAATTASVVSVIGTVSSIAGVGMSAMGAMNQSQASADQAAYQAQIAQNNSVIAERRAADALKRGEREAQQHKAKVAQLKSRQLVSLAGQGADVTEGSAVDLLADTAELGAMDEDVIKYNSAREAYEHRVNAQNFTNQSTLYQVQSDSENPLLAGGSTLLTGAGNVASRWFK